MLYNEREGGKDSKSKGYKKGLKLLKLPHKFLEIFDEF